MNIRDQLDRWATLGIIFWEDNGQLRYRAPRGAVTPETLAQLRDHKQDILEQLRTSSGPQAHPEDRYEPFPLTDVQGAYLMGRSSVFEYGGVACHIYCEINYPRLDPTRAMEAWHVLIKRHDMLRVEIDASGFQRIRPEVPQLKLPVTTLASAAPEEREVHIKRVRERLSCAVHPTGSWPMFAVELTQPSTETPEALSTMHISFDFLVGDWASLLRLIREWEKEYEGNNIADTPHIQFRDYVLWEQSRRYGKQHQRAREYWLQRIEQLPKAPQLPRLSSGHLDSAGSGWRGQSFLLSQKQWQAFQQQARNQGISATAAVLACYADVLSRWAEDPHFCLNLTVLDRPAEAPELAQVIGDFTSVTLLEVRSDTRPFNQRAREMFEQLFTDLDHRSFSGVAVMREIARLRGRDAAAMPYVFTSAIGLGDSQATVSEVRGSMEYTISQTPQAFLDCQVMDDIEGLHVHWDAREGIFPEGMLADMFTAFTAALSKLADEPAAWSGSSPAILPPGQRQERDQANNTGRELPTGTLLDFVIKSAHLTPSAPAVLGRELQVSYEELLRRSVQIAAALTAAGVSRGDRIAIAVPKSADQIAAVLGVLGVGAAYVPLDIRHPRARLAAICADANVAALVHVPEQLVTDAVPTVDLETLCDSVPDAAFSSFPLETDPNDLAYVIYTSGSTGRPKGVEITHRAVVNTIMDVNERFTLTKDDRTLAIADLGFDLSVYDIFGPLSVGGAVVIPPADTVIAPATWLEIAKAGDVTTMNIVPAVGQLLLASLNHGAPRPDSIRQWILSGDRIPPELVRELQATFPNTQFVAMGGATEAAIWSIAHPIAVDDLEKASIPYGLPLANQRFNVVDALGRERPTWVPGEIVIKGVGLANGYCNAPELTEQSFVEDHETGRSYRTGDQGCYLPGGEIEIFGRLDDQVKINGHRIELAEIESVIVDHEAVSQAAVVVADNEGQRRLHAFVVPDIGEESQLRRWAQEATSEASANIDISDREGIASYALALEAACAATLKRTLGQVEGGLPVSSSNEWIIEVWRHALAGRDLGTYSASEVQKLWNQVSRLSPRGFDYRQFTDYVRRSAEQLPALLAGQVSANELLFPEGSNNVAKRVYQDRASLQFGNAVVAALSSLISAARKNSEGPLRILEIGAGTGSTTEHVRLGLEGVDFRYTFTDRFSHFLSTARQRWGNDDRWSFETLDVDKDFSEQGFADRSYDLVCAFGVLENARDIPSALGQLSRVVADGGLIMLSEPVDDQWWVYVSQIFLMTKPEGNRHRLGMFPSEQWWATQLAANSGNSVTVLPEADSPLVPEQLSFFIARVRSAGALGLAEELVPFLSQHLPEVMLPQQIDFMPELPLTRNGKIDKRALRDRATGMFTGSDSGSDEKAVIASSKAVSLPTRTQAFATKMSSLWAEQLGLSEFPDSGANPFNLGANSISAAAVAGRLREEESDCAELSFETILRTLLNSPTIAAAAEEFTQGNQMVVSQPEVPAVVLSPLREQPAKQATSSSSSRVTVIFGDSLVDSFSTSQLAASLPEDSGGIVAVMVPDDAWLIRQPPEAVTDVIANIAAASISDLGAEEYRLVGYSYGALAAIEVARRLLEAGRRVLPLGLIDPHIVPVTANDQLSEIMFLTARGVSLEEVIDGKEKAPQLVEILEWVSQTRSNHSLQVSDPSSQDRRVSSTVERFFAHLEMLGDRSRWQRYQAAIPAEHRTSSIDRLHEEWLRYRHIVQASTVAPDPLIADAVIIQPDSSHGFLPGAHKLAVQTWRETFIGNVAVAKVAGDHFTMLHSKFISGTTDALIKAFAELEDFLKASE